MNPRTYFVFPGMLLTAAFFAAQSASAQPPAPAASTRQGSPSATAPQAAPVESPAYTYDPQGRRDPFVSLSRRGTDANRVSLGSRSGGISGLEVAEVVLKGTIQSPNGYVALVEATDKKSYVVKSGDRLLDGTVRAITADAMVILQQVNDPLSLEKQREVRKILRQTDEVK